jgi:hypothetical protein
VWRRDLDIPRRLLVARHSHAVPEEQEAAGGAHSREFVSYEYAWHTYPGPWLFPHADGTMLDKMQKLRGHSDPKITERRYGHLLPDFMKSEVDRLRFGLDAPRAAALRAGCRRDWQ